MGGGILLRQSTLYAVHCVPVRGRGSRIRPPPRPPPPRSSSPFDLPLGGEPLLSSPLLCSPLLSSPARSPGEARKIPQGISGKVRSLGVRIESGMDPDKKRHGSGSKAGWLRIYLGPSDLRGRCFLPVCGLRSPGLVGRELVEPRRLLRRTSGRRRRRSPVTEVLPRSLLPQQCCGCQLGHFDG